MNICIKTRIGENKQVNLKTKKHKTSFETMKKETKSNIINPLLTSFVWSVRENICSGFFST